MCKVLKTCFLLVAFSVLNGIEAQFSVVTNLTDGRVDETSGLIYLDGRIITHNDSGGSAKLYEIDSISGDVMREVNILGASNTDWEDITLDDDFIYIGDFGNNNGNRTNLAIYKISIAEYLAANSSVEAEEIKFEYADQVDFSSSQFQTDFDAETLISFGDSLLIFTKQWGSMQTAVYVAPKTPGGPYQLAKRIEFSVEGLVTGGTYDGQTELLIVGYNGIIPFYNSIQVENLSIDQWSLGDKIQLTNLNGNSAQIEAITTRSPGSYFLSAEKSFSGEPALYLLEEADVSASENAQADQTIVFPNPTSNQVLISDSSFEKATILDALGRVILTSNAPDIDVSSLRPGTYILKLSDLLDRELSTHQFIIRK